MAIRSRAERRFIGLVVTFLPYWFGFKLVDEEGAGQQTFGAFLILLAVSLGIFITFFGGELPKRHRPAARVAGAPVGPDLRQVRFIGKDLTKEKLAWADLTRADLTGAKLAGVDLTGANLTDAVLARADLVGANLIEVNITGADLRGTNLAQAVLSEALWDPRRPPTWPEGYDPPARGTGPRVRNLDDGRSKEDPIGLSFEAVVWTVLGLLVGAGALLLIWRI